VGWITRPARFWLNASWDGTSGCLFNPPCDPPLQGLLKNSCHAEQLKFIKMTNLLSIWIPLFQKIPHKQIHLKCYGNGRNSENNCPIGGMGGQELPLWNELENPLWTKPGLDELESWFPLVGWNCPWKMGWVSWKKDGLGELKRWAGWAEKMSWVSWKFNCGWAWWAGGIAPVEGLDLDQPEISPVEWVGWDGKMSWNVGLDELEIKINWGWWNGLYMK
jgi:hypothetical protein